MDLENGHNGLFPRIQVLWLTAFCGFSNTCPSVLLHTQLHSRIYPHLSAECFCSASWTNSNQKMLAIKTTRQTNISLFLPPLQCSVVKISSLGLRPLPLWVIRKRSFKTTGQSMCFLTPVIVVRGLIHVIIWEKARGRVAIAKEIQFIPSDCCSAGLKIKESLTLLIEQDGSHPWMVLRPDWIKSWVILFDQ